MITVFVERIPRGGFRFKWENSGTSFESARFYGYSLRGAIQAWRKGYGFERKHINFMEV